jgi:hypothetical protein
MTEVRRLESHADSDDGAMSKRTFAEAEIDRWAEGRRTLRAVERIWVLAAPATVAQVDAGGDFRPWRTLAATYLYRSPRT